MTTGIFTVNLGDLEDGPKELQGPIPQDWVRKTLKDDDVEPSGDGDGSIDLTLTKTGSDVLVQGSLDITVSVPCARTLDPAIYRLQPEVFLMLAPGPSAEVGTRRNRPERQRNAPNGKRPPKKGGWDKDPELTEEEAAQDTYSGDQIVLDAFLREFILLELPMLPLREDLRGVPFEATPPLPNAGNSAEEEGEQPLDPRLSPLRDLKARLENKE